MTDGIYNFSSRSDSLSIGAEAVVSNEDTSSASDDDDEENGGPRARKRQRVSISSSSEEETDSAEEDGDTVRDEDRVVNNNPDRPQPEEQDARHPVPGSRGSPVYMCARKLENDVFECKFCNAHLAARQGTTTSVSQHMIRYHQKMPAVKEMIKKLEEKREQREKNKIEKEAKIKAEGKQLSMKGFVTGGKPVDPVKRKNINAKLIDFLVASNEGFSVVENPFFRALMFEMEPGFIVMSRTTATRASDESAASAREKLRDEILDDLKKAGHSTISITSDHGTSRDSHRTKKNALTVSRTLEDFSIKTDTLDLIICEESQTGANIRSSVKRSLVKWAGYDKEKMTVNWVTDNEAKQVSARNPHQHKDSGLLINYEAGCVDHLIELAVNETLRKCFDMEHSVNVARDIINYMKESSLSRVKLMEYAGNLGMKQLSIVKGTMNRWFSKYFEMNRFLDLEQALKEFQAEDLPSTLSQVNFEDWSNLRFYVQSLKSVVDSATMLESETSCTSSSVIPFIATIFDELESLKAACSRNKTHLEFIRELIQQLKRRFPNQLKLVAPFNALCLLDPRHLDIYFNEEETDFAKSIIIQDKVFEEESNLVPPLPATDVPAVHTQADRVQSKAQSLRTKLLQKRFIDTQVNEGRNDSSFEERIEKELKELLDLKYTGLPDTDTNPSVWWRDHQKQFPLLSRFWKANSSFPATSTASERVFNVDGLVLSPFR